MEDLTDLISDLVIRQAPKRKQFSIPLKFGGRDGDIEIGVAGWVYISAFEANLQVFIDLRAEEGNFQACAHAWTTGRGSQHQDLVYRSCKSRSCVGADGQETGAELSADDLTTAYEFGTEAKIENVLEPNWWETPTFQDEQRAIAEELVRIQQARHGGEEEDGDARMKGDAWAAEAAEHPKLIAKTRVSFFRSNHDANLQIKFTDEQIRSFKTMDIDPPREFPALY